MGGRFGRAVATAAVSAVAAVMVFFGTPSAPALAHNSLVGSSPKDGATLARPPAAVRLTFLSRVDPATTRIAVTGPDGRSAAASAPAYAGGKVTVPFRVGLAGRYLVAYRVASDDGHPLEGSIRFTVTTGATSAATASPSAASTTAPAGTPAPAVSPGPAVAPASGPAPADDGPGWQPWAIGAAVLVVLAAGALVARRRLRR